MPKTATKGLLELSIAPDFDKIATVTESQKIIAEKAPAALRALKQMDAMDLAEMLGLSPYFESEF